MRETSENMGVQSSKFQEVQGFVSPSDLIKNLEPHWQLLVKMSILN
jgi:hypothetical protein